MPLNVPKLVLCEAEDDIALVEWVAQRAGADNLVFRNAKTWTFTPALLEAYVNEPVFQGETPEIVVVFDADDNPNARRIELADRIHRFVPDARITIYLLPNDADEGEVEDLFLRAVTDHKLLECADDYAKCVLAHGYQQAKSVKLRYLAYAAPIRFARRAIQHASFDEEIDLEHPDVQKLAAFLRGL